MNSYKATQDVGAQDKWLQPEYARVYASFPESYVNDDGNRQRTTMAVLQAMDGVFKLDYAFATTGPMSSGPFGYFFDEAKGRKHSASDKANALIWAARRNEMSVRVRDVYETNLLSKGHLDKLGGSNAAMTLLSERIPGVLLKPFSEGRLLVHSKSEAQRAALSDLFVERDVLMVADRGRRKRSEAKPAKT